MCRPARELGERGRRLPVTRAEGRASLRAEGRPCPLASKGSAPPRFLILSLQNVVSPSSCSKSRVKPDQLSFTKKKMEELLKVASLFSRHFISLISLHFDFILGLVLTPLLPHPPPSCRTIANHHGLRWLVSPPLPSPSHPRACPGLR